MLQKPEWHYIIFSLWKRPGILFFFFFSFQNLGKTSWCSTELCTFKGQSICELLKGIKELYDSSYFYIYAYVFDSSNLVYPCLICGICKNCWAKWLVYFITLFPQPFSKWKQLSKQKNKPARMVRRDKQRHDYKSKSVRNLILCSALNRHSWFQFWLFQ